MSAQFGKESWRGKATHRFTVKLKEGTVVEEYAQGGAVRRSRTMTEAQTVQQAVDVVMEIDVAALFQWMAARAAGTKGGISKLQDGMIVARVLTREPPRAVEKPRRWAHPNVVIEDERELAKPLPFTPEAA